MLDSIGFEADAVAKHWAKDPESVGKRLEAVRTLLDTAAWTMTELEAALRGLAETLGVGAGKLFQPMRVALTGRSASPGIFDVLMALGREKSTKRIDDALAEIGRYPTIRREFIS